MSGTPASACAACGEKFKGKRKDARFCSDTCRQRAHRQPVTAKCNDTVALTNSRDEIAEKPPRSEQWHETWARPYAGPVQMTPRGRGALNSFLF